MKNEKFWKRVEVLFCLDHLDHLDHLTTTWGGGGAVEAAGGDGDGGADWNGPSDYRFPGLSSRHFLRLNVITMLLPRLLFQRSSLTTVNVPALPEQRRPAKRPSTCP